MTLSAGTRLGPYEILSPLGAGGMGEVYRSRDLKLHRDVAVKVLPESLANDTDALARFEREALAVAALNHPNILSIFDFGSHEGMSYAVMELLEGETLRELLGSGPIPVRRATEISRQIATGLAAAHGKGIVHRDLKPDNVFITHDGRVKILDFGLAKALTPNPSPAGRGSSEGPGEGDQTHSPTVSAFTEPGTVMGTVGYMSPEQVRGRDVDQRADIFAFGAVLYEMLTGRRAFQRETAAETMTAILREEPPDPADSGKSVPASLERIIRHCLEKKPEQRFQSASDIAFALEDSSGSSGARSVPQAMSRRDNRFAIMAISFLAAGLLGGAGVQAWLRRAPAPVEPIRIHPLTFSGRDSDPTASPDGKLIAFTSWRDGTARIWVKQLAGGGEAPLTSGPDRRPRFSPDGSSILFLRDLGSTQAVFRVGLVGGEPRKLIDDAAEADWSPDGGKIGFFRLRETPRAMSTFGIFDLRSGKETAVSTLNELEAYSARWSPDGRTIAFSGGNLNRNSATWKLYQIDVAGGQLSTIRPGQPGNALGGIAWSGNGRELFFIQAASVVGDIAGSGSQILRSDIRTGKRTPVLWADGLAAINASAGEVSRCDVLSRGRLVFTERLRRQNLRQVSLSLDRGVAVGSPRLLTDGGSIDRQPTYSPDGKRLMFSSNRSGNLDLWVLELSTGALRQLTDDRAQDWDPAFTPDGKSILWDSDRSGNLEVWIANADGSGARQLTNDGVDAENPTETPDGKWVVYWSGNAAKHGVWKIRPDGTGARQLLDTAGVSTDVSPDGRYVLYTDQDRLNLRDTIRFIELESGHQVPFSIQVPYGLGSPGIIFGRARWSRDLRTIYFIGENRAGLTGVFGQDFAPGRDTSATRRAIAGFSTEYVTESLGFSPDNSALTISTGQEYSTVMVAENVPGAEPPERKSP